MASVFFDHALLPNGWARAVRVRMADGRFQTVQTDTRPEAGDERHGIGLPGLCNLHSHGFQRGMAGLSETRGPADDSFWTWREVMYRFLSRLTPDDIRAITAMAYMEMLESGFTRVGEFHYLHNDVNGTPYADPAELCTSIAEAAELTGINLTLLPCFYAHGNFGGAPPTDGQRRFITGVDQFAILADAARKLMQHQPGGGFGVAPHSLRAVAPDELRAVVALAQKAPIHMHISEQTREVDDCLNWCGARPVEWLLDNADVNEDWCLIHATHMTDAESDALARSGAVAGLCPITEQNLGDGIFGAATWQAAHGRFGIGTDSNVLVDATGELRQLEYAQRLHRRGRNLMAEQPGQSTGAALFQKAGQGAAQALAAEFGIAPGQEANLLALRADHPALVHRHGDLWLDGWIFAAKSGCVKTVWARGKCIVRNGEHCQRALIETRYRTVLHRYIAL